MTKEDSVSKKVYDYGILAWRAKCRQKDVHIAALERGIHRAHTTMVEWDKADSSLLSATAADIQQELADILAALDKTTAVPSSEE